MSEVGVVDGVRVVERPPARAPFKIHTADANRQKRRAIIKAIGARQFKKLYRKIPA